MKTLGAALADLERKQQTDPATCYGALRAWMETPQTLADARAWLGDTGVAPRAMLGLLFMHFEGARMFDARNAEDSLMRQAATRAYTAVKAALLEGAPPPADDLRAALAMQHAWTVRDRDATLRYLMDSVVLLKAKQRKEKLPLTPPAGTFEHIRRLGGVAAEHAARRRYDAEWEPAHLRERVTAAMKRAYWDRIKQATAADDLGPLFAALGELQGKMTGLIAHSERATADLEDKFDAKWLRQRADAGCLTTEDVQLLVRFLADTIVRWQAPADDAGARAWWRGVVAMLEATKGAALRTFAAEHLIDFVAGAFERVDRIYARVEAAAAAAPGA